MPPWFPSGSSRELLTFKKKEWNSPSERSFFIPQMNVCFLQAWNKMEVLFVVKGACLCWNKEWRLLHALPQCSYPLICIQAAAGAWRTVTPVSAVRTETQSEAVSVCGPWASASVSPGSSLEMQMPDSTPLGWIGVCTLTRPPDALCVHRSQG